MKTGKGKKEQQEIHVRGRTFIVDYFNEHGGFISSAEFTQALEEAIKMGDQMNMGHVNGVSFNRLGQKFDYREVTAEEDMDNYVAANLLTSFMGDLDSLSGLSNAATLTKDFGQIYTKIREKELSPEEGARQMNDLIALARQEQHQTQQQRFFDTAKKWANKPNHSVIEVAHGVAYDAYRIAHPEQPEVMAQQSYRLRYDNEYGKAIKARTVRAAKDLFGT
jgi:hypothetical protein